MLPPGSWDNAGVRYQRARRTVCAARSVRPKPHTPVKVIAARSERVTADGAALKDQSGGAGRRRRTLCDPLRRGVFFFDCESLSTNHVTIPSWPR